MRYELKIIHDSKIYNELLDLFKNEKINGYTTVSILNSCGKKDGVFKQDVVSGEKLLTYVWFLEKDLINALHIKKEFEKRGYFIVLSKLYSE